MAGDQLTESSEGREQPSGDAQSRRFSVEEAYGDVPRNATAGREPVTVQALSVRSVLPPMPASEFGTHAELLAAMGVERPFARRRWIFDMLTEFEVARLGALAVAEKRGTLAELLRDLATDGYQVRPLPDNIRIARWNGEVWQAAGQTVDRRIETVMALYIDRSGNRSLPVGELTAMCRTAWDSAQRAVLQVTTMAISKPANAIP